MNLIIENLLKRGGAVTKVFSDNTAIVDTLQAMHDEGIICVDVYNKLKVEFQKKMEEFERGQRQPPQERIE